MAVCAELTTHINVKTDIVAHAKVIAMVIAHALTLLSRAQLFSDITSTEYHLVVTFRPMDALWKGRGPG